MSVFIWVAPHENWRVSGICRRRRPRPDCADRPACASAQSDQGLHCALTESLDTIECMNGEQIPGWCFALAQDDLKLHILRIFKDTFSLSATHIAEETNNEPRQRPACASACMLNIMAFSSLPYNFQSLYDEEPDQTMNAPVGLFFSEWMLFGQCLNTVELLTR